MNKMKRSMWLVCGLLAAAVARPVMGGEMIAGAAGKTGLFTTKLTGSCSEAERDAIVKRMSLTGYAKHDLATTSYDIYVPKEPGKDGKYGLIVSQNFREYGKPPTSWEAVLDKYHIIWMGPQGITDGTPTTARVGYTLDAVYNAENTWSIDMNRVYLFNCSKEHTGSDLALYYPDVFTGSINCAQLRWFHRLSSSSLKGYNWDFPHMAKPDGAITRLAKTRKYVLIDPSEEGATAMDTDVATEGYVNDGYKGARFKSVKTNMAQKYQEAIPDWFEESIVYLDSGSSATSKPATSQPAEAPTPSIPLTSAAAEVAAAPAPEPTPKAARGASCPRWFAHPNRENRRGNEAGGAGGGCAAGFGGGCCRGESDQSPQPRPHLLGRREERYRQNAA